MHAVVTVDPVMMRTPVTRHPHVIRIPFPIMWSVDVIGLIAHFDVQANRVRERS